MTRGQHRMRATLTLIGTIVGAGIFGVPAMIGAWGVGWATLGFVVVTLMVLGIHLFFTEAVLSYTADVRMTGFTRHWLGSGAACVVGVAMALSVFGSNLAYIILGGEFFQAMAVSVGIQIPLLVWQVVFWVLGAITVLVGLKWVSRVESFLVWILVALLLLIIGVMGMRADAALLWQGARSWTLEPYGVFLYSLMGFSIIAEMEVLVRGNKEDLRKSVLRGTVVSAALTYAFGVAVWLASGGTLGRTMVDLINVLPPWLAITLPAAGFLAVITSFMTTAFDIGAMFKLDYHFPPWLASTVALGVPFVLLFLTERDFLATIGLVGSVFTAIVAICIVFMGRAALIHQRGPAPALSGKWWVQDVVPFVIAAILTCGGIAWFLV